MGLISNIIEGATAGSIIGAALDGLFIAGATVVGGPVGFALAAKVTVSKTALGTLIGAGEGIVKTVYDLRKENSYEE